ncbi:phosphate regulon transcriptional regulatory protein PhoB [Solemya pervernicosa gill symbiont]|uniref:Phosphate regulon transcriptional regulatory protein PhoB n=2 Tax=Gammaproteobacteria incertae sedis TaxID=118884 RepID=A0A1T2L3L3_9GAMM|nr:phosphate regulon transcriptional regulator PhoB [Candidatus Reidiella endopervernicosa]OOZ39693.1 phosphate regulon transcriptional regulatory protein PhoB [Solemya pervernicosa gill symbiont]QKQ24973.1 phosphate regulon transcriptional regulator PhoB [Candidatus Reidiella endopervernicosa]
MIKHILVVEDETAIREMVADTLIRNGYECSEAGDAEQAVAMIADRMPDLVLLDWMMPGMSGIEMSRRLKRDDATRELPIILLTARGEEEDKVSGLESGADDYVTKPFSTRELLARIKAVLRRVGTHEDEALIVVDGLELDPVAQRVSVNAAPLTLGPTEYRLLHFFMSHPERVYSRSQLLDRVWGGNVYIEERTVDVHIRRLRKVLEPGGYDRLIQTVRGSGYRFSNKAG